MLRISLVDANERANREYAGIAVSVVSGWLTWEAQRAGIEFCEPQEADVVLLSFAGALDWRQSCISYLRRYKLEPEAARRNRQPYIITGGPVDATPFTALEIADALAVGEGIQFVRTLLQMIRAGAGIQDVRSWIIGYPHAIEREQIESMQRDAARPWLLSDAAPVLATPDDFIDWDIPPVRSADKVVRIIAEKGCHCKCTFCATTYRQAHRQNPNESQVLTTLGALKARGERVQLVSNDPMNLPYFRRVNTRLDSQSFTIMEVSDPANRRAIIRSGVGIARFGVEGISERIRKAFAKPISNDHLLDVIADLHANRINTHMFFIVGAPGETVEDWIEFKEFYRQLARVVQYGICRIKFTTFVNTPPAPLARFVPDSAWEREMNSLRAWISSNSASRHVVYIAGRRRKTHVLNVAEQLSVNLAIAQKLVDSAGVYDLLPTADDARRAVWEVVGWPIPVDTRYRISEIYARRMFAPAAMSRDDLQVAG